MGSNQGNDGRFKKGAHWRTPQKHWSRDWLVMEYVAKARSAAEIAAECGCRETNILYWLAKHGIPRRTMSQVRRVKHWGADGAANPMFGKCDEANPNWKGGESPDRQKLYARHMWKSIRRAVMLRDGVKCVRCGAAHNGAKSLHTHHIKPWARNIALRFDTENIVTLCRDCHEFVHSRANSEMEYLG